MLIFLSFILLVSSVVCTHFTVETVKKYAESRDSVEMGFAIFFGVMNLTCLAMSIFAAHDALCNTDEELKLLKAQVECREINANYFRHLDGDVLCVDAEGMVRKPMRRSTPAKDGE